MLELKLENGKYYYYENGQKVTGWFQDKDDRWYHLNDTDGSLDTNWFHASGYGDNWFYAYTENIEEGEKKHYLGEMATGWIQLDNKWYFLLIQRLEYNSNTHYKGEMVSSATLIINNKGYTFDENGVMENGYSLVSDSLVSFIVDLETFHDKTYEDPSHIGDQNYWTIGYGTRYSDNPSAFLNGLESTCTKDQGLIYLKEKITKIANTIKIALGDTVLSQQTFDTLCDIAYTEGTDAVTYSKTWDAIVNGTALISTYIMSWNKSNGKYSEKLNQRCKYRCNMCLNGMWYFKVDWKQEGDKWKYQCYDGTFQTGWKLIENKWYYFDNNGVMQIGWIKETDGKYYYLYTETTEKDGHTEHKEGEMATDWIKVDGKWYYMFKESKIGDDKHKIGEMAIGDHIIDGNWYYFYSSGEMAANFWRKGKNDTYYYYNSSGKMVTGWETIEGKHYHFDSSSGVMKRGWFDDNNNTYYFYYDGSMALGFMEKAVGSDTWYYFNIDTGINETGWAEDFNGKWYHLNEYGKIEIDWKKDNNKWYYLYTDKTDDHSKGQMATGWIQVDEKWYYMFIDKDENHCKGEMAIGWQNIKNDWYYLDEHGVMQTGWIKLDGKDYYLYSNGVMATNWARVGNDWYYFDNSGVMQNNDEDEQEIWLPSTLYDYDIDSEKYSITSQNILADLSQQWFDAETAEDKHEIERRLLYFRAEVPSDSSVEITYQKIVNLVLAGVLSQLFLDDYAEASKDVLYDKINKLGTSKGCYIVGQVNTVDSGNVRVYRVEGKINERIIIGENGEVAIKGTNKTLYLNFGDAERANEFLIKRLGQGMKDAVIKSFQVPESFLEEIKLQAVPESEVKLYPGRPIIADPTKAENQFGLRPEQIGELENEILENTGEIVEGYIE